MALVCHLARNVGRVRSTQTTTVLAAECTAAVQSDCYHVKPMPYTTHEYHARQDAYLSHVTA